MPLPRRRFLAGGGALLAAAAAGVPSVLDRDQLTTSPLDWPMPRYDPAGTAHNPNATAPPGELTVRWRTDVSEHVRTFGPPIRVGETLVTAGRGLVAVDAATGDLRWAADGRYGSQPARVEADAYRTDAFAVTSDAGTFGVHASGGVDVPGFDRHVLSQRWTAPDAGGGFFDAVSTVPTAVDGTVYTGVPGTNDVVALDGDSGAVEWRQTHFEDVGTSVRIHRPAVGDGTVFVATSWEQVAAYDAATGEREWLQSFEKRQAGTPALTDEGLVVPFEGAVALLDPADGATLWDEQFEGYTTEVGVAVADGTVLFGGDSLVALDLATGERRWSADFRPGDGHPVVVDGTVYVGGRRVPLTGVDLDTGERTARYRGEHSVSRPIPGDGVLYVTDSGDLVALEGSR